MNNSKQRLRLTAVMLLAILLTSMLVSCGGRDTAGAGTETEIITETVETTTAVTLSEKEILYSDLPTGSFNGYEFRIISYSDPTDNSFHIEAMDGDVLHDAIFARNRDVSELLDVSFNYVQNTNVVSQISSTVIAGDDAYDLADAQAMHIAPKVTAGIFLDLYDIETINTDKPWWDAKTAAEYELMNRLYFIHGDINTFGLGTIWSIYFNNKLVKDSGLKDMYKLVNDGCWTIAKLSEYGLACTRDLNGDGNIHLIDDVVAMMTNNSFYLSLLHGAGESLITKDKDGIPIFEKPDARMVNVFDAIVEYCMDSGNFFRYNTDYGITDNNIRFNLFASDMVLFSGMMVDSGKFLRDMENDFGLLPLPKYDDSQEEYYSYQGPSAGAQAVPSSIKDPDMVGTIIENLCAFSHYEMREAYFETTLQDKIFRDVESNNMLDIIYGNVTAELGYVYGYNKIYNTYINAINNRQGVASSFESVHEATNVAIEGFIADLD